MSENPKLKRVLRLDSIPLDETYWTKEGYLIDHPIVTSIGIFEYVKPGRHCPPGSPVSPKMFLTRPALPATKASRSSSPMRPVW